MISNSGLTSSVNECVLHTQSTRSLARFEYKTDWYKVGLGPTI